MTNKITPAVKGLITGILMVVMLLIFHVTGVEDTSPIRLLIYFIYGIGMVWAIVAFSKSSPRSSFGNLFNAGFKCFIIVVILIVIYTIIFYKIYYTMNPDVVESSLEAYRQHLTVTEPNLTPGEIDERVNGVRQNPVIGHVYKEALFNFLIGAIVTAATAGTLSLSKKN